jgi:hypothetical protein
MILLLLRSLTSRIFKVKLIRYERGTVVMLKEQYISITQLQSCRDYLWAIPQNEADLRKTLG